MCSCQVKHIFHSGEQKYEKMIEMLTHLTKHVPTVSTDENIPAPGEESVKVTQDYFHATALGKASHVSV